MRRIFAIALVLTVFLPSIAFARPQFLCGSDGKVRARCCCPEKRTDDSIATTSARAASCCKVTPGHAATVAPAEARATRDQVDAPLMTTAPIALTLTPAPIVARATTIYRSNAPPDPGAALFVRHCALLL